MEMLPLNSPKAETGADMHSTAANHVPISLNGLFGEVSSYEDHFPASLALHQSPPGGSIAYGKQLQTSPSKSPNILTSVTQQPVLLSELADGATCEKNLSRNALCSFVSEYNIRCTNLAAMVDYTAGKSYCSKHLYLARPNQHLVPVNRSSQTHFSRNSVSHNPFTSFLPDGTDLFDSQTFTPAYSDPTFMQQPVKSYSTSHQSLPASQMLNLSQKKSRGQVLVVQNPPSVNATQTRKGTNVQKNVQRANNSAVTVNGDVLRAVVDLLNQNHSGLTTKQQIKLLNSLGVIVATVKNPAELQKANAMMPQQSTYVHSHAVPGNGQQQYQSVLGRTLQQTAPVQSVVTKNHAVSAGVQSEFLRGVNGVNLAATNPTAFKRKAATVSDKSAVKKSKMSTSEAGERTSLHHLTALELDEKVSQALASVGALPHSQRAAATAASLESKRTNFVKKAKKSSGRLPVVSSVNVSPHPTFVKKLTSIDAKRPELKKYIELARSKQLGKLDLHPLGPFCEDAGQGVCTCVPLQYKTCPVNMRRRSAAGQAPKVKPCRICCRKQASNETYHDVTWCMGAAGRSLQGICSTDDAIDDFWTLHEPTLSLTGLKSSSKPSASPADIHCQCLQRCTKKMKGLLAEEKRALRLLLSAAKSDPNETATVLRKLGTNPVSCKKRCDPFAKPRACRLVGGHCRKRALPYAEYCLEHIWHSEHQQLYKLSADMNVVADLYPEPVMVRPRKKTKLPPLSKKKKRKVKKLVTKIGLKSSLKAAEDAGKASKCGGNDSKVESKTSSVESAPAALPVTEPVKADVPPVMTDEESVMEAFNLDGTEFLSDVMPDLLQEFNLFAGKNVDMLECALLAGNPLDDDDAVTGDRLTMDDDSALVFPMCSELEADKPDKTSAVESTTTSLASNSYSSKSGSDGQLTVASCPVKPEPELIMPFVQNYLPTMDFAAKTSRPNGGAAWPVQSFAPSQNTTEYAADATSSLDSSFADDLNELEGVIESLRDEVQEDKQQDNKRMCPANMDADVYTSILAREISEEVESKSLGYNSRAQSPCSTLVSLNSSWNTYSVSSQSVVNTGFSHNLTTSVTVPAISGQLVNSSPIQSLFSGVTSCDAMLDASSVLTNVPTAKKCTKASVGKKNRNKNLANAAALSSQFSDVLSVKAGQSVNLHPNNTSAILAAQLQSVVTTQSKKTASKLTGSVNGKIVANPRFATQGNRPSNIAPVIALASPQFRMQPKLVTGNVVCPAGKPMGNQMVLIPVTAFVQQQGGQAIVQGANHQSLGLAFALPAGQSGFPSNVATMVPVRGSSVVPGAVGAQQLVFINGNQVANPVNVTLRNNSQDNGASKATRKRNPAVTSSPGVRYQATTSHIACTSSPLAPAAATSSWSTTAVTSNQSPVVTSKKTKRNTSLGIPPVVAGSSGSTIFNDVVVTQSPTKIATSVARSASVGSDRKTGTVHWNQSTSGVSSTAPPVPQPQVFGAIGGQTSNMLYCRRISPTLNNNSHQIVVGRLGSLGRVGISRLAVNERLQQYQKQQDFAKQQQEKQQKADASQASPLTNGETSQWPDTDTAERSSGDAIRTDSLLDFKSADSSSALTPAKPATTVKRCRKSEHTATLLDPDFCESSCDSSTVDDSSGVIDDVSFHKNHPD